MKITNSSATNFIAVVWPLCILSSVLFLVAKMIYPQVDWAVVVCALLLFVVGVQLRLRRKSLLAESRD